MLDRTLIVSYLKMIIKMSRLPPWKNFCGRPWIIVLSRFCFLVTFVLSLITNCLLLSVLLISVANIQSQLTSCSYFIKITCN